MNMEKVTSYEEMGRILANERAVLVLLKSRQCSVCDAVGAQLLEWEKGVQEVSVKSVQIEEVPEVSGQWTVFTAPTLVFFVEEKEVWRGSRFIRWDELDRVIERVM
ncbi:thioredoxin domain-containing protein [Alteribacter aurantiacus]|uniref:thioredoxin domain-containing protein n=1 Tax=Alteribacter aurantiacus TaxID=254410 RepID=UPI00040B4AEF|nr:thioredoxin family protein [Alteribacter aurantiacus]